MGKTSDAMKCLQANLKTAMSMTDSQCFITKSADYIEGQQPAVLQIVPGNGQPEGGGSGFQIGGCLHQNVTVNFCYWVRVNTDLPGYSANATLACLDGIDEVKAFMRMTWLGGALSKPAEYLNESEVHEAEPGCGVFYKTASYKISFMDGAVDAETLQDSP
jgi:hypothetical protein